MANKTKAFKKHDLVVSVKRPDDGYPHDSAPMRIVEGPYDYKGTPAYSVSLGAGGVKVAFAQDLKPAPKLNPKDAHHDGTQQDKERAQELLECFAAQTREALGELRLEAARAGTRDPVAIAYCLAVAARKLARVATAEGDAQRAYWGN